jgi:hypothetical protein
MNVTDHAILRYDERYLGLEVEEVRSHIASCAPVGMKNGTYHLQSEDLYVICLDGVARTVITKEMQAKRAAVKSKKKRIRKE